MEQQFLLKEYGKLSLFEQDEMTAEERSWWVKRIDREMKTRREQEEKQAASIPRPRR